MANSFNSNNQKFGKYGAQDAPSINTNSIPLYNGDMCLKMSFLNDSLSLRFIPAVIREDGSRSYPRDTGTWCVIKIEYAVLMLNWLKQYFIPYAKANYEKQMADPSVELDPVMIGVPTNKESTTMIVFRYDQPKDGAMVPKIILHTGIDMTRKPANTVQYEFGVKNIFTKYDDNTGEFAQSMDQVQFWVFYKTLEHFVEASTMAEVHADKYSNNFVNREMRDLIRQIAMKNGIQVYQPERAPISKPQFQETTSAPTIETTVNDMMSLPGGEDMPF